MAKKKVVTKKKSTSSTEGVIVDFSDVESRGGKKGSGGRKHYPEGDYAVKVKSAKFGHSGDKETPRLEVTYIFTQGKLKGKEIRDDLYLTPKSLWRLRQALEAFGMDIPSKRSRLNPATLTGKQAAVTLEDDEYDDKIFSKVADTYSLDEFEADAEDVEDEDEDEDDEDDEDDEEDDEDDEEDDDEEEDEELEEVDLDDL